MPVFGVQVGVALQRPPRIERYLWFRLEAPDGDTPGLWAAQWAASRPGVVMPLEVVVLDWP